MPNLKKVKSEILSIYLLETNNSIDRFNVLHELEEFFGSLRKLKVIEELSKGDEETTEVETKNYPEYVFTESELDRIRRVVSEMQLMPSWEVLFINGNTILQEIGDKAYMDSLDQIEMLMAIEEEFACVIDENLIEHNMTVAQLLGVATFE